MQILSIRAAGKSIHSFPAAPGCRFQSAIENREKEERRNRFVLAYSNVSFSSRSTLPFLYLCLTPERGRVLYKFWIPFAFAGKMDYKWQDWGGGRLRSVHFSSWVISTLSALSLLIDDHCLPELLAKAINRQLMQNMSWAQEKRTSANVNEEQMFRCAVKLGVMNVSRITVITTLVDYLTIFISSTYKYVCLF